VLHTALADALEDDLIRRNPAALRDKQRRKRRRHEAGHERASSRPRPKAWTEAEQHALVDAARTFGEQLYALVVLALDSGMRRNELLGLMWSDFAPHPREWKEANLDDVTVTVRRQLSLVGAHDGAIDNAERLDRGDDNTDWRQAMFGLPKSGKERTINLAAGTVAVLRAHFRHQQEFRLANSGAYKGIGLVFARELGYRREAPGRPIPANVLDRQFKKVVAAAKVPTLTFHSCRHSVATTMLLNGVAPVVVSKHLGHSNTTVTLMIYAHCLPAAEKDAAKTRGRVLHGRY
jgi:integrase